MPVVSAPRLRLWPPSGGAVEAGGGGARLDDAGDGAGIDRLGADDGEGEGACRPGRRRAALQMRRNSGPSAMPAASCQRRRARTGQSAVVPYGSATVTALAGALALGARQGEAEAALARLEMFDPDGGELGAAQRAGEADQQQGAVAPATQIVRESAPGSGAAGRPWRPVSWPAARPGRRRRAGCRPWSRRPGPRRSAPGSRRRSGDNGWRPGAARPC